MENVHAFAHQYVARGFAAVPVEFRGKACKLKEWQKLKLGSEEVQTFFDPPCNLGVVLGNLSGGLVDIDLDCAAAIDLAPYILPETKMVFGRASKPRSHWIYKAGNPGRTHSFPNPDGGMLVELRANGSMTVFPGSVHESGEPVVFERNDDPAEIGFDQLTDYARQLAAASLVLPHWHEGTRHKLALALSGTLLTGGVSEANARQLIEAVIAAANDEEPQDRFKCLSDTAGTVRAGQAVAGRKELADIIGEKATERFCEWLGLKASRGIMRGEGGAVTRAYGGPVPESDTANAERFAARNGERARYCYGLKKWLVWDGCRWAIDEDGAIDRLASATVKNLASEAAERNEQQALQWAARSHDFARLRSMVILAQSQCAVRSDAFDADPWKLNCRSGIIDLTTGEQMHHDPAALMRKLAPVDFNPAATCPVFLEFLNRVFGADAELIAFLQRAIGYSLTGKNYEQCWFVMVGVGANGKSTLIHLLQDLLGDYAMQTPMDTLMTTKGGGVDNDIARLQGARFVAAVEAEAGQRIKEAKLKQLTGGDRVAARFLYGEHFEFVPQFKLWLATNKLPEVKDLGEGFWRRLRVVPFNVTIPDAERDPKLSEKLKAELPGILNWALAGCLDWQRNGLMPPAIVTDATKLYRADMDVVTQFIEDCCVPQHDAQETVKALYGHYTEWCHQNGESIMTQRSFGQRLQELGYEACRVAMVRKRQGIRLKTALELAEKEMEDLAADFAPAEAGDANDATDAPVRPQAAD